MLLDYSWQRATLDTMGKLIKLAEAAGLKDKNNRHQCLPNLQMTHLGAEAMFADLGHFSVRALCTAPEPDGAQLVRSPSKLDMMDQSCHEALLRSKTAQQQRLAAASQLMASANSFPYSSKCMNFLLQQQQTDAQRAAAALIMGDDIQKFSRSPRLERNEFPMMNGGAGMVNPASRQIYLTFPADSTFREEDVSNYFSIYGPVQDVRIPYQQKRMFGFVTFVYPYTVKLILAKGNPHFVCDARVLVKPYKEKGKVHDRKQQGERGDLSPCGTPTGLDGRDPYDLQLGARMFYNSQDMLWRSKLEEQAELQQALELQSQLTDKQQKHTKFLEFLALSKCHEELCSRQRKQGKQLQ